MAKFPTIGHAFDVEFHDVLGKGEYFITPFGGKHDFWEN